MWDENICGQGKGPLFLDVDDLEKFWPSMSCKSCLITLYGYKRGRDEDDLKVSKTNSLFL